jgi:predicted DNA-binding WGR domain protein
MLRYFRHTDPKRNRRRHYLLSLQRDIFGQLVVLRQWGRIGAPGWQGRRVSPVATVQDAARIVKETCDRRRWHGYDVVDPGALPEA